MHVMGRHLDNLSKHIFVNIGNNSNFDITFLIRVMQRMKKGNDSILPYNGSSQRFMKSELV